MLYKKVTAEAEKKSLKVVAGIEKMLTFAMF